MNLEELLTISLHLFIFLRFGEGLSWGLLA